MPRRHAAIAALLLPLLWQPQARAEDEAGQLVVINGTRSPELQPYRYMLSGLDAFEDNHALAPNASEVRFRLHKKGKAPADAFDTLTVRLLGNETEVPLPLAPDHSFTLPRHRAAEDDNADVVLNQKKSYYGWMPDVRSAGVPAGMRRLGDIRLECRVMVGIAKNYIPFMVRALINTLTLTTDWCSFKDFKLSVRADHEIDRATLIDGATRIELKVSDDGQSFSVPIGNKQYGNDALIEFN
ncbi:hypothetical protein FHW58_001909 [Duganella sp. 1224]|uniref:hypothetical protein n=1 Tax=Duganella sp. 1224 TaxID=2587052 RepID=UPI0015CC4B0A|nr:hypothetical protein [Duganella sp. 1224]NYE60757.1 hypothetical protein [Duganella sp. 1224]